MDTDPPLLKKKYQPVFRIRIDLKPDPAFLVNTDPDSDPGLIMTKMKEFFFFKNLISIFQSIIGLKDTD